MGATISSLEVSCEVELKAMSLAVLFAASFQEEPHNLHIRGIPYFTAAYTRTLGHLLKGDIIINCSSKVSRSSREGYEDTEETSSQAAVRQR